MRTRNTLLRVNIFDTAIIPNLTFALKAESLCKQDERLLYVVRSPVERFILRLPHFAELNTLQDGLTQMCA
ncbi:hypothetical protein KIN20_028387 [Parelaphostrongylus tenuis]|uniref:Uncharacterized protein n=1 Tax=Parelaphostrongylus tenuis TaxID=148309 RepID=A0AAD5R0T0_PARTN|nr:hypothetical protein KIN20_028387 [Parelaphostrongylus tenuis]